VTAGLAGGLRAGFDLVAREKKKKRGNAKVLFEDLGVDSTDFADPIHGAASDCEF
jgi:hypothetical protein